MPMASKAATELEYQVASRLDSLVSVAVDRGLAVAVSGGADSMALCLLAAKWARQRGALLQTITVDHGLRPGSDGEAIQVSNWLKGLGMPHQILRWQGPKPKSGIQARARTARYELLSSWCREHGIYNLATAHHFDDQLETVLLRLEKASGFAGLAGMADCRQLHGVNLLRPLLPFTRHELRSYLEWQRQDWLDDPSNDNAAFARIRMRRRLQKLIPGGEDIQAIVQLSIRARRLRQAWRRIASHAMAPIATVDPAGYVQLSAEGWQQLPTELASEILRRGLMIVSEADYGPDRGTLERLVTALRNPETKMSRSLNNCQIRLRGRDILVYRENRNLPPVTENLKPGYHYWGNYRLTLGTMVQTDMEVSVNDLSFGPLGKTGWKMVQSELHSTAFRHLPAEIFPVLPCLRFKETVVFVPYLGFMADVLTENWQYPPIIEHRPRHEF